MGINPYNYNTIMAKVRAATVKLTEEVKAVATRALGRAEEAYEYAEEAGQIADTANRLAEDIIYTHLQYDENATYSKMVYGINILGQEPENWLQDKRYNTATGELEDYDNRICTDELISVTPGSKYIFSTYDCKGYIKQLRVSIVCYDADGEYVGYLPDKAGMFTVTIPSNTAKIGVTIFTNEPASSFTILTSVIGISIFPWSVTPLEEDTDATYIGMYSSNEQEIPDETDPAGYNWKAIKTTEEGFTPIIPGTGEGEPGPPGPPGEPGATGVSITRAVFEYAVNNSTTTPPVSGWSETQPAVTTENPVLWQRIKTDFSDGTTQYTGTVPSVVFQSIVTFINAAQSGQQGTVINGGAIDAATITALQIAANTITGSKIAADTITAYNLAAAAVTATELAANSVTAEKMSVANLSAIAADMGYLTAGKIENGYNFIDFTNALLAFKNAATWNASTSGIYWDGNRLYIRGDILAGNLNTKLDDLEQSTFSDDHYSDGTHTVWKNTATDPPYYYYIGDDGAEHIVQESDLERDQDGNIMTYVSLSGSLMDYQNQTSTQFAAMQSDISSRPTATDIQQQIEGFSNTVYEDISEVASTADSAYQLANQAQEATDKYDNYLQFTANNGLRVGYVEGLSHVDINGSSIQIFNSDGNLSIDIRPANTRIPTVDVDYAYFGNYIIQYKSSTNEIVCRKVT